MSKALHGVLSLMVESDLTAREWYVLSLIQHNEGLALIDLFPKQKMPKSTLGRLVHQLVGLGLVKNNPDVEDYRRQQLALTEAGREKLIILAADLASAAEVVASARANFIAGADWLYFAQQESEVLEDDKVDAAKKYADNILKGGAA